MTDAANPTWPRRVLFVCSSGGHLAQLHRLQPWWSERERTWVTFDTPDAVSLLADEDDVVWAHHPTTRSIPNLARNLGLAMRLFRQRSWDVVISDGAAVAVPFFMVARARGIPTVYLEVYDRIDSMTLTGKLCRPMTSLMLVQWEAQKMMYPEAEVTGVLL